MTEDSESAFISGDGVYEGAERQLVRAALKRTGWSARQAALLMDMSDTRLRHIMNGYQPVGRGQKIPVIAPADTLARIAAVLQIHPTDLVEVGREDAAEVLAGPRGEHGPVATDSPEELHDPEASARRGLAERVTQLEEALQMVLQDLPQFSNEAGALKVVDVADTHQPDLVFGLADGTWVVVEIKHTYPDADHVESLRALGENVREVEFAGPDLERLVARKVKGWRPLAVEDDPESQDPDDADPST